MSDILYCIGDSHASFFAGENTIQPGWPERAQDRLPYFRSYRLGAVLAYNLCKTGTKMRGRERLFEVLETDIRPGESILFVFGEIDCRAHLLKQSHQQKRPITSVVDECVERYFSVVRELQTMGYQMYLWNALPSTRYIVANVEFPTYGSPNQRNHATRLFNTYLQQRCTAFGAGYVSIYDSLVDARGRTEMDLFMDNVHLSQRAMPLTVAALKPLLPDIDFDCVDLNSAYYNLPNKRVVLPPPPRFPALEFRYVQFKDGLRRVWHKSRRLAARILRPG